MTSPYRDWYYFIPADPPGTGVCAGDTNYVAWWGFDSLPKLNTIDNEDVRDYLYRTSPAIGAYWLTEGAGGWRLDVAGDVDDSFWRDWRPYILAADPEAITIAEEWGDASRFILGDMLDSSMNYRFRNAVIGLLRETDWQDTNSFIRNLNVSQFDSLMHSVQEDYPPEAYYAMMNLVGSHDVNRVLVPLDLASTSSDPTATDWSLGKARLQMLALVQMTLPGAPTIYYGDEVGLVGYGDANGGGVFYSDPYNRQPYPWPDEPGYGSLPAWRQQDMSLYGLYSSLTAARNGNPALRTGSFDTLLTDDTNNVYAYGRKLGDDAAVVAVNLGPTQTITVDVSRLPARRHHPDRRPELGRLHRHRRPDRADQRAVAVGRAADRRHRPGPDPARRPGQPGRRRGQRRSLPHLGPFGYAQGRRRRWRGELPRLPQLRLGRRLHPRRHRHGHDGLYRHKRDQRPVVLLRRHRPGRPRQRERALQRSGGPAPRGHRLGGGAGAAEHRPHHRPDAHAAHLGPGLDRRRDDRRRARARASSPSWALAPPAR